MKIKMTLASCMIAIRSTAQLFNTKPRTTEFPVPNGCCVLLKYNQKYYCLSNAHVLADRNLGETYFIFKGKTKSNVGGQFFNSKPPEGQGRDKDLFDMAIVQLSQEIAYSLLGNGKVFLDIDMIRTGKILKPGDEIFFAGYPASKTKVKVTGGKVVSSRPFYFQTSVTHSKNVEETFDPRFHIIAKYSLGKLRTLFDRMLQRGPHPQGMSGSGIWGIEQVGEDQVPYLIGIFSEYDQNRSLLIGTKIDLFIDLIRQTFDSSIPNKGIRIDLLN